MVRRYTCVTYAFSELIDLDRKEDLHVHQMNQAPAGGNAVVIQHAWSPRPSVSVLVTQKHRCCTFTDVDLPYTFRLHTF